MAYRIWGHRGHRRHRFDGYSDLVYENSLKAYELALSTVMGVEADIIQSSQATIFLAHDTKFTDTVHYELKTHLLPQSRELIGNKTIYQLDDKTIEQMRLKDGQPIPKLKQLFDLVEKYPWAELNLELKGPHTTDIALRTVEAAINKKIITPDQIIFSSFNLPALRDLREKTGTRFRIGALFALQEQTRAPMYPGWLNAPQNADYVPFGLEHLETDLMKAIAPDFFNLELSCITPQNIFAIQQKTDAKIIVWAGGETHPADMHGNGDKNLVERLTSLADNPTLFDAIYAVISDFPDEIQNRLLARTIPVVLNPVQARANPFAQRLRR